MGKKSRKKTGRQGIPNIKRNTEYEKKEFRIIPSKSESF